MNRRATIETRELERLVDGELSDQQYRDLLERLEASPEDWRRCALMFLEQQMLTRELGAVVSEWEASPTTPVAPSPFVADSRKQIAAETSSSKPQMNANEHKRIDAASWLGALIAACVVGFLAGGLAFPPTADRGSSQMTDKRPSTQTTSENPSTMAETTTTGHPTEQRALQPPTEQSPKVSPSWPVFVRHGTQDDQGRTLLPAYPANQVDQAWVQTQDVLDQSLSNYSGRVRRRWQFKPVVLDDGTQVVVPIEHVELLPQRDPRFAQ